MNSTRPPVPEGELIVVEDDGRRLRVACLGREGPDHLRLLATSRWEEAGPELLGELGASSRGSRRPAIVITHRARPIVGYLPGGNRVHDSRSTAAGVESAVGAVLRERGATVWGWEAEPSAREGEECRFVAATVDPAVRERWRERLAARGLRLEGIYPQLGAPLCALEPRLLECPTLALQVEAESIAVMELVGGRCHSIEVHPRAHPTPSFCTRLIGIGCPEVLLFGGDDRLAQLGYEIARGSGTWIRLQRVRGHAGDDEAAHDPPMAILGAAYHTFGLASVGNVACIPPAA